MTRKLDESILDQICSTLLERFGEPIGDVKDIGPGVADERGGHPHRGEDPGNYGFGADTCECGGMMGMDESICTQCGMMPIFESENGGRHPGHAASCTCPDCSRPVLTDDEELDEVTPPGREKQVKALKKQKGVKNPWAVAWASYDRSHKR